MNKSTLYALLFIIVIASLIVKIMMMREQMEVYNQMIVECEKPRQIDKCYLIAEAE